MKVKAIDKPTDGDNKANGDGDGNVLNYKSYVNESKIPNGLYDFPQRNESYLDDGTYPTPFQLLSEWFLTRRRKLDQ